MLGTPLFETAVLMCGMVLLGGATLWLLPWTDTQRALTLRGAVTAQSRAHSRVNDAMTGEQELAAQ